MALEVNSVPQHSVKLSGRPRCRPGQERPRGHAIRPAHVATKARAIAAPMPDPAPVTIATWPAMPLLPINPWPLRVPRGSRCATAAPRHAPVDRVMHAMVIVMRAFDQPAIGPQDDAVGQERNLSDLPDMGRRRRAPAPRDDGGLEPVVPLAHRAQEVLVGAEGPDHETAPGQIVGRHGAKPVRHGFRPGDHPPLPVSRSRAATLPSANGV